MERTPHAPARAALAQAVALTVLAETEKAFRRAGINLLPVKGVVTSRLLYSDPGEREIRDVDVRIRPSDFFCALRASESAGWPIRDVSYAYRSFVAAVGGMDVDVETSCGPPHFSRLTVDAMMERAQRGPEPFARTPELHDHVLLLSINAAKDHFASATSGGREDLRRMVKLAGFSPLRLIELASTNGVRFILHATSRSLRDEPIWQAIDDTLSRRNPMRARTVDLFLDLVRGAAPAIVARVLSRLAPDGFLPPARALNGAILFELEATSSPLRRKIGALLPLPLRRGYLRV